MDWRLTAGDGPYEISDAISDGVSMGATERSEFAARWTSAGAPRDDA
jgi:ABC-type transporter MlaC component